MSAYEKNFLKSYIDRTKHNNKIVEENNGYEITQLMNSLLGLIVFPQTKLHIGQGDMKILLNEECKNLLNGFCKNIKNKINDNYNRKIEDDISIFVKHIRDAIAHGGENIVFITKNNEISEIEFKDRKGTENFSVMLDANQIKELTDIVEKICLAKNVNKKRKNRSLLNGSI